MTPAARLSLVDRADGELSLVVQCRMLKVARSTLYWRPAAASEDDLRLMRLSTWSVKSFNRGMKAMPSRVRWPPKTGQVAKRDSRP